MFGRFSTRTTQPRVDELKQLLRDSTARQDTEQTTLLIAVDFGVTYTGVAFVFTSKPDAIHQITEWPSMSRTLPTPKVPTLLKYESPGNIKWGYEVSPTDAKRIEGFKQLLDSSLPKPLHVTYPKVQSELKTQGKDAFQVTYAYMKALYDHVLPLIEREHTDDFATALSIKFVFSFPPAWPTKAKQLVQDAAGRAGFAPMLETIETEAAATYALTYANLKSAELQVGDNFTLVDAGGGLVSVMSYKISKITPLMIEQLVPATSGTGGSLMLNRGFEHYLQGVIDEEELMHLKKTSAYSNAIKDFEEKIKPSYSFTGPENYRVTFPGARLTPDPSMNLEASAVTISSASLKKIFQSVIKEISELIKAQIRSVELKYSKLQDASLVKCIILVGGLGENKHLLEYLTKDFPKFQIMQPEYAWTAVCRGSLIRHLPTKRGLFSRTYMPQPRVRKNKKAEKSYGIQISPVWDAAKHGEVPKFWDPWESVWRCTDVVWFVSKGDDISRPRTIPLSFHKECPPHPVDSEAHIKFEIRESPIAQTVGVSFPSGWSERCREINIPLVRIPPERFVMKIRKSDGTEYWDLEYKIMINIEDMVLRVWVEIDGVRYGVTNFH